MTCEPPDTTRHAEGLSIERPPRPAPVGARIRRLRGSATTPASFRAMAVGAAVGPVVGLIAHAIIGGDRLFPFRLGLAISAALCWGIPTGAVTGLLVSAVRRPQR